MAREEADMLARYVYTLYTPYIIQASWAELLWPERMLICWPDTDMLARYIYSGQLAIVAREEADMLAGLARLVSPAADRMWPTPAREGDR